jgi:hypothetical protein
MILTLVVGCPRPQLPPVTDNAPAPLVVERVNRNVEAMNFLLRAGGVSASGRVARASGRKESFDANGTLFFRRPRDLYMELKHSLAGKIELGSNSQEFWYWERFEHPRYFTGQWSTMAKPWESDIPLRPDQLLDMLGFRELPVSGATFSVGAEDYGLQFADRDSSGRSFHSKTVSISRRPPFLVSSITYYNPGGKAWMKADLQDYRPIEGTTVMAPRRIQVQSLDDQSRLTLEFANMRPSDNQAVVQQRIAQSPLQRHEDVGEIVRLDRPAPVGNVGQLVP